MADSPDHRARGAAARRRRRDAAPWRAAPKPQSRHQCRGDVSPSSASPWPCSACPMQARRASAGVYRLGDWPSPFGIVLVLDRLSALMLLLTSILASAAVVFSLARWHRAGAHFHSLFQFLLMGLNGAFLTGDLFNLFVFFELLLAASYGLALHGSGAARVKAGLHYIVVNLAASLLFLIGVSLIYGVSGTLNMADLAARIPNIAAENRALLEAGAGILGVAFLLKAGMWPLCFWLPTTYAAASAARGVHLRDHDQGRRLYRAEAVAAAVRRGSRSIGGVRRRAGCCSAGWPRSRSAPSGRSPRRTWLGSPPFRCSCPPERCSPRPEWGRSASPAERSFTWSARPSASARSFCWSSSSNEVASRERTCSPSPREAYGEDDDIDEEDEVGIAIPATMGMLGLRLHRLRAGHRRAAAAIRVHRQVRAPDRRAQSIRADAKAAQSRPRSWALLVVLILSGLAALIAMTRAGIRAFWAAPDRAVPRVRMIEMAPVAVLLILCAAQTVQAGPVMRFMQATAQSLHAPGDYVRDVLRPANNTRARRAGNDAAPAFSAGERRPVGPVAAAQSGAFAWARSFSACVLALAGGWALTALQPPKARVRRLGAILRLSSLVLADIVRSNIAVGRIVLGLGGRAAEIRLREHPSRPPRSLWAGRAGLHHHGDPRNPVGQLRCGEGC